jgi:cellobiose-specific phosphotransferase system component IIC
MTFFLPPPFLCLPWSLLPSDVPWAVADSFAAVLPTTAWFILFLCVFGFRADVRATILALATG